MIDAGLVGGVPREQKLLKGHLPRVIYHQVYLYKKINIQEPYQHTPLNATRFKYVIPPVTALEREFFIDNLLVRIHFIIVMIRWSGLAPWEFEFPFPGSLTSTFLGHLTCTC